MLEITQHSPRSWVWEVSKEPFTKHRWMPTWQNNTSWWRHVSPPLGGRLTLPEADSGRHPSMPFKKNSLELITRHIRVCVCMCVCVHVHVHVCVCKYVRMYVRMYAGWLTVDLTLLTSAGLSFPCQRHKALSPWVTKHTKTWEWVRSASK